LFVEIFLNAHKSQHCWLVTYSLTLSTVSASDVILLMFTKKLLQMVMW